MINKRMAVVSALLVLVLCTAANAVDPPSDEGTAIVCMYTYFDDVSGPADGEVFYPEYLLLTPMDLYTVLYYPHGVNQTLGSFDYSVRIRQGGADLQFGVDYGYLTDQWVPAYSGEIGGIHYGTSSFIYLYDGFYHGGEPVVIRHSQLFLMNLPLPGADIEVFFEPYHPSYDHMIYTEHGDAETLYDALPNSVDHLHENPVFVLQGDVVSVESRSLSSVKQLFR